MKIIDLYMALKFIQKENEAQLMTYSILLADLKPESKTQLSCISIQRSLTMCYVGMRNGFRFWRPRFSSWLCLELIRWSLWKNLIFLWLSIYGNTIFDVHIVTQLQKCLTLKQAKHMKIMLLKRGQKVHMGLKKN